MSKLCRGQSIQSCAAPDVPDSSRVGLRRSEGGGGGTPLSREFLRHPGFANVLSEDGPYFGGGGEGRGEPRGPTGPRGSMGSPLSNVTSEYHAVAALQRSPIHKLSGSAAK